jgi:hypothetical protein
LDWEQSTHLSKKDPFVEKRHDYISLQRQKNNNKAARLWDLLVSCRFLLSSIFSNPMPLLPPYPFLFSNPSDYKLRWPARGVGRLGGGMFVGRLKALAAEEAVGSGQGGGEAHGDGSRVPTSLPGFL